MRVSRQQPSISIQQDVSKSLDVHSSNSQRNEQLSWSLSRSFNENTRLTQLLRSLHQATQKNNNNGNNNNNNTNNNNANRFNFISQQQFLAPSVTSATTRKAGKAKSRVDSSEITSMNNRHSEIERLQNTSQTSKHQQQQHQSSTIHSNDIIHIKPTTTTISNNNNKEQYYQHNQLFEQKGNILLNSYLNATIEAKAENGSVAATGGSGRSTRYKGSGVVSQSQQHSAREQKLRSIYGLRPQTTYSAQGNYCSNEAESEAEVARRNAANQQYKSYSVNSNKHTNKESSGGIVIPKSGGQLRRSYHLEKGSSSQQQQQQNRPGGKVVINPLLDTIDVSLRSQQTKPIDNNMNFRNTSSRASNHSNNTSIEAKTNKTKNAGATEIWKDLLTMQSQQQTQQTNKNAAVQNYLLNYNYANSKDSSINSTIQHSNDKITIHSSNSNNGTIRSSSRTGRERANSSSKNKNQQTQQINGQLTKDRSKTIDVDTNNISNSISRKIPYAKVARTSRYASVNSNSNNNTSNHNTTDSNIINSSLNNITGIIDGITTTKTKPKAKTITPMLSTGNNQNNTSIQPLAPRSTENNNNNNTNTKQKKTLRSLVSSGGGGSAAGESQQIAQSYQTQQSRVAGQQKQSNNNHNNLHNIANLLREQENIYLGRERMLQQQHNIIDAHSSSDHQMKNEEHLHNHSTTSASSQSPFSLKITSRSKQGVLASNPAKPNQDSLLILENLCGIADWTLFVVCDGHGTLGHLVSQFVVMNLHKQIISDQQMLKTNPKAALFNAVGMTNHYLVNSAIDTTYSGTTLVCVLIQGTQLYTANVGDSRATRAIVETSTSASKNGSDLPPQQGVVFLAEALTIDQKPSIPSEAARIYESNGRIDSFRDKQGNQLGPLRVWLKDYNTPGLAMSRSLGDDVATSVGVTWEPEIDQYEITDSDKFLIVGSDGLWEFIDDDKAVGMVQQHYVDMDIEGGIDELMTESYKQWTIEDNSVIDDTTVILVFFIRNTKNNNNNNNNNQSTENNSNNQGKNNKNFYELQ